MSEIPPKHLLTLCDLRPGKLAWLIDCAERIKRQPTRYMRALYEKCLLMIFEAPSLRTRLSFEAAMTQLHGHAINYYTIHSPWGIGKESIEDVARTVSRYCDTVSARIYSHSDLVQLAANSDVPVINAMTDHAHPCQVLGDLLTIRESLGRTQGLRIAYVGDACNNVTYSLMRAAVQTGNVLFVACPDDERFRPEASVFDEIRAYDGGQVEVLDDPREAVRAAEVVYTDSWMSYRINDSQRDERIRALTPYRVTAELMKLADPQAVFMHCLPAMRDQEVTAEVIDGPQSIVFDQAENRLHIEKAILLDVLGPVDLPVDIGVPVFE